MSLTPLHRRSVRTQVCEQPPDRLDLSRDRVEGGAGLDVIHVISPPLSFGGKSWVRCSCGLVLDFAVFSVQGVCPIEWERAMYLDAVATQWRISARERRKLQDATARWERRATATTAIR